ncbi:hypothetical protein THRCLA_11736 [Thraustotheca clavata]|uniref:Uncharacterized protein n=1 Tax=Thraustotheca clavata TaxID=74557 RepID=A0A1V9Y6V4_9STRA|nr:hypothetical protein THRCLA_11736 [Thraustotheca clavata]
MGSGCTKQLPKPIVDWESNDVAEYVQQNVHDEQVKDGIVTWIKENDIHGHQLVDMEMSMVLSELQHLNAVDVVRKLVEDFKEYVIQDTQTPEIKTTLKELPNALEKAVYVYEKYPLIIDYTGGQAAQFFKYQRGCLLMAGNRNDMTAISLRRHLVAALKLGSHMTICFDKLAGLELESFFVENFFPKEILDRHALFKPEIWSSLLRKDEGDPDPSLFNPCDSFKFAIICGAMEPPPKTRQSMCLVKIYSPEELSSNGGNGDDGEDPVASAFGLREVRRNSLEIVEAGFDGDLEALKALLEKGYHLESEDGHKHTALSEAACQGHDEMIAFLLQLGANPNALNDAGRSPLFRAAYNGHNGAVEALLNAGGDPRCTTKQGEKAFDVAKTKDIADILSAWNIEKTEELIRERKKVIESKLQERLTSHVERERVAVMRIHQELIAKAASTASSTAHTMKEYLVNLANEAIKHQARPRGSADIRDERGATLLSIAAQHDNVDLVAMLLTYYKSFHDDDHILLRPHRNSPNAKDVFIKVFKTNVNTRDSKGWTPIAVAIFHQSKRAAQLLLKHGANPRLKNQYNKDAFDLAQDEIDAALNVVTSRAEIRSILLEWESEQLQSTLENNRNRVASGAPDPLPLDGGATLLAIEVTTEGQAKNTKAKAKKKFKS